jgi:RNA polymerase sigma factor (sigma-70 family)
VNRPLDVDQDALAARLVPVVRAFARRRCARVEEVDDFSQDAVMRILALVEAGKVEHPDRLGAFALGVCRKMHSERCRRERRRRELWERWAPVAAHAVARPVEFDAVGIRLEGCLTTLTQRAREIVRRTWFLHETGQEIGAVLSMSASGVRVARHRALSALNVCMRSGGIIGH